MADAEFVENPDAINEILHSDGVRALLEEHVNAICDRANATLTGDEALGYEAAVDEGSRRLRGHVWAAGQHAKRSNAVHNTLVRVLGL